MKGAKEWPREKTATQRTAQLMRIPHIKCYNMFISRYDDKYFSSNKIEWMHLKIKINKQSRVRGCCQNKIMMRKNYNKHIQK